MKHTLILVDQNSKPIVYYFSSQKTTFGRKSKGHHNDIDVTSPIVSQEHGFFEINEDRCYYVEHKNSNGTYINRKKLTNLGDSSYRHILNSGDIIQVDSHNIDNPRNDGFLAVYFYVDEISNVSSIQTKSSIYSLAMTSDYRAILECISFNQDGIVTVRPSKEYDTTINEKIITQTTILSPKSHLRVANKSLVYFEEHFILWQNSNNSSKTIVDEDIDIIKMSPCYDMRMDSNDYLYSERQSNAIFPLNNQPISQEQSSKIVNIQKRNLKRSRTPIMIGLLSFAVLLLAVISVSLLSNRDVPSSNINSTYYFDGSGFQTEMVTYGNITEQLSLKGNLYSQHEVAYGAKVVAPISTVCVKPGDIVNAGDILIEYDYSNKDRMLSGYEVRIAKKGVVCDVNGVVISVDATVGAYSELNKTLVTVVDTSNLVVKFSISSNNLSKIKIGQEASVVYGEEEIHGAVSHISSAANESSNGGMTVDAYITLDDQFTAPIYLGEVKFTLTLANKDNVLTMPLVALNETNGKHFVYVVLPSGEMVGKYIEIGNNSTDKVEIVSGLNYGEMVVTEIVTGFTGRFI